MSDVKWERSVLPGRCRDMRVRREITPAAEHPTEVAAVVGRALTLGLRGPGPLRRPREIERRALGRPVRDFAIGTGVSLRAVTGYQSGTSPGSGAVASGVMKLTCTAISNSRRQGGMQPMSLAPEAC
jgi:hypothetical protein